MAADPEQLMQLIVNSASVKQLILLLTLLWCRLFEWMIEV